MVKLILPLKAEYFDAIRGGNKTEEYRLANAYWSKRLIIGGVRGVLHLDGRELGKQLLNEGFAREWRKGKKNNWCG